MNKRTVTLWITLGGVLALAGGVFLYLKRVRPWHLHWGATPQEVASALPSDDLILGANWTATRAVTIEAPPGAIWPWLVQMGYRRAGWYSYDWLDNDGIHVDRIIPELQQIAIGDLLLTDSKSGFRVEAIEPERSLVLMIHGEAMRLDMDVTSVLVLVPIDAEHTRLILRARAAFRGLREMLWGMLLFDVGDFVMMRKMLLGIKARAEAYARPERHPL
jgi:hypothetical protein